MPTSPYAHLYSVVRFLDKTRPSSLLDIGVGNGKLGFIARDLLDVMLGQRYKREDWKIRIDGIEVFSDYIQAHQKAVYDEIYIGDAFGVLDTLETYDMIILGDVLEHFEKKQGSHLLDKCVEHSNKHLIICLPLGEKWIQPEIYGNPYERHRSSWEFAEFKPFVCDYDFFPYKPGRHGAFLIKKEDYIDCKIKGLQSSKYKRNADDTVNIRYKYGLSKKNIARIDLSKFFKHVVNVEHLNYFSDVNFKEHYRLIAYLSTLFNKSVIFDIGTNKGYSALALAYNNSNIVISYDIVYCRELGYMEQLSNIEYRIGDVMDDKRLFASPLIMLDTNHDGVFEDKFYEFLRKNKYNGLLFLDDIQLNQPMKNFWNSIQENKEDLTDLGHWSGSGLVDFSSV